MYCRSFLLKVMKARFRAGTIPWDAQALVIGTSRTKYIKDRDVGAAVHSYRGANLIDLFKVVEQYPPLNLNTVTLIAGFNDHRIYSSHFVICYQALIQLIVYKFQPKVIIAPKVIDSTNNPVINKSIYFHNCALYNFFQSFSCPSSIFSPFLRLDKHLLCRDGIHFSFKGNNVFSKILSNFISYFS